jgi:Putative zinc-finger
VTAEWDCARVRDLIPELAVGVASGEERARALQHLAQCPECRRELEQLSELADELLLLAPDREPPIGFETRVLEQLTGTRRRRWRAVVLAAAAAIALTALSGGLVYRSMSDERLLAAEYREVLTKFDGRYFQTATLHGSPGEDEGQVFGYQGTPSWVFMLIPPQDETRSYAITLETRGGGHLDLGKVEVGPDGGSWGKAIPVDLGEAAGLWLEDEGGHALEARFPRWPGD